MQKGDRSLLASLGVIFIALSVFAIYRYFTLPGPEGQIDAARKPIENMIASDEVEKLPPFSVGASVDKAYYKSTVPILMYHHIRVFYDPKNPIDTNLSTPPANFKEQIDWLKFHGFHTISMEEMFAGNLPDKPVVLTFDDGYQDGYDSAYKMLKDNGQVGVFFIITGAIGNKNYMSADELKEMAKNNMEIESHTVNHPNLTKLSKDELDRQITKSKQALEDLLGSKVDYFCYPSGQFNDLVIAEAKAAGYKAAVTVNPATSTNNLYTLPRIRMNPGDSSLMLDKKIKFFMNSNSKIGWDFR